MKINVNRSYFSGSNYGGIDGIFLDHDGSILLHCGKHVPIDSPIQREVLILREGFLIAAVAKWSESTTFLIESNS